MFLALVVESVATFSLSSYGYALQPIPLESTQVPNAILPRNVIIPLTLVNQIFSEITQETGTGANMTAVGNPRATRSVIYASSDNSKKATITVDQYKCSKDASSAFQQAIQKSQLPEFKSLSVPTLGQISFAGTVTRNEETHIGLGILDGYLIIGVTLAGYDASPDNIDKLVKLARTEISKAEAN